MDTARDVISRLPELPVEAFEVAGRLGPSARGPYLTITPHTRPEPRPPAGGTIAAPNKSSACVRKYYTQAIYPRVICYDPGDLLVSAGMSIDKERADVGREPLRDVAALARKERLYKLSALNGATLKHPYWCSVKYGPWLAIASESESCTDGEQNRWEFFIVEVPEVALIWWGRWEDMPAYPSLQVTMGNKVMFSEERVCCPGFQWCATTQSCIPSTVDCGGAYPA